MQNTLTAMVGFDDSVANFLFKILTNIGNFRFGYLGIEKIDL